ncbi:MAG: hypothetical protein JZU64_10320 [Rhodoferax sp.]|nr:hypothetical protein [Rhodoferax sp.]
MSQDHFTNWKYENQIVKLAVFYVLHPDVEVHAGVRSESPSMDRNKPARHKRFVAIAPNQPTFPARQHQSLANTLPMALIEGHFPLAPNMQ